MPQSVDHQITPSKASTSRLSAHLARFAYSPSKVVRQADEDEKPPIASSSLQVNASKAIVCSTPPAKRRRMNSDSPSPSNGTSPITSKAAKPKPKSPRGYASPEAYSHLKGITDYLQPNLSLIFCGINPGKMSSIRGHHFAHPSNKFWKALAGSGFTDTLRPPEDDHLMPELFDFGLTNLIPRVTSEQAELSTIEMRLCVPQLLAKLGIHKPKVCCFVGKKIWDVFEGVVKKTAGKAEEWRDLDLDGVMDDAMGNGDDTSVKDELLELPAPGIVLKLGKDTTSVKRESLEKPLPNLGRKVKSPRNSSAHTVTARKFDWDQPRPFVLYHDESTNPAIDGLKAENVEYTLFWVVPSTSGLERTPFAELVEHFMSLRMLTRSLGQGDVDLGGFRRIDVEGVKATVKDIEKKAVKQIQTIGIGET